MLVIEQRLQLRNLGLGVLLPRPLPAQVLELLAHRLVLILGLEHVVEPAVTVLERLGDTIGNNLEGLRRRAAVALETMQRAVRRFAEGDGQEGQRKQHEDNDDYSTPNCLPIPGQG